MFRRTIPHRFFFLPVCLEFCRLLQQRVEPPWREHDGGREEGLQPVYELRASQVAVFPGRPGHARYLVGLGQHQVGGQLVRPGLVVLQRRQLRLQDLLKKMDKRNEQHTRY